VDGRARVVAAFMTTVAITPYTGANMAVAPDAKVDDRHFDVVVRQASSRLDLLRHIVAMKRGKDYYRPRTISMRARDVRIEHVQRSLRVHADSNALGPPPAHFELLPAALAVLVGEAPPGQSSAIVGRTTA